MIKLTDLPLHVVTIFIIDFSKIVPLTGHDLLNSPHIYKTSPGTKGGSIFIFIHTKLIGQSNSHAPSNTRARYFFLTQHALLTQDISVTINYNVSRQCNLIVTLHFQGSLAHYLHVV
jgi:hypothetical protein